VSLLAAADAKCLRVRTSLSRGDEATVVTGEHPYLHVDGAAGRVTAMPADRWMGVAALLSAHASPE
jgi:hypothetical protein